MVTVTLGREATLAWGGAREGQRYKMKQQEGEKQVVVCKVSRGGFGDTKQATERKDLAR